MSTTSLQLRSVNLFLGSLPSRTDAGPRSQWEVLPGVTGTIQDACASSSFWSARWSSLCSCGICVHGPCSAVSTAGKKT